MKFFKKYWDWICLLTLFKGFENISCVWCDYIYIYIYIYHCWRSRDELISDVLLWTPTYGRAKAGRLAQTYIQQLCEDTGCSPEDRPEAINNRKKWWERVRDIRASGTTRWWWYIYINCSDMDFFFFNFRMLITSHKFERKLSTEIERFKTFSSFCFF